MDGVYERAFGEVMGFLEREGYGLTARNVHREALTDYGSYLRSAGVAASAATASEWAAGAARDLAGKPKGYAAAARRVAEAVAGSGEMTPRLGHGNAKASSLLAPWSREVLEAYSAEALEGRVRPAYAAEEAARASDFLSFCEARGLASPEAIGVADVVAYQLREDPAVGGTTARLRVYAAKSLLLWLSSKGRARLSAAMMMDALYTRHLPLFEPVEGDWAGGLPADEFRRIADAYVGRLAGQGYGRNVVKVAGKCLGMLFVFLDANGVGYTPEVAAAWAARLAGPGGVGSSAKMYRRALASFEDFRRGGDGLPGRPVPPPSRDPLDGFPAWSRGLVGDYLRLLAREGLAKSTADCARSALGRLAAYLDSRGVDDWGLVTPGLAAGFPLADAGHASAEGRQLYARKAAAFLAWLGELGVVPETLSLAVPTAAAPRSGVVEVLSGAELAAVAAFRAGASTPTELRDAAMVSLGLREGLRACDVAGIALSDVDWRASTLAVVQRKTLARVELPLAPEAGNDLMRYILEGRPESGLPNAFVLHRAPYGPVGRGACGRALARVLAASGLPPRGFHALRRTFATGMLSGGAGRHLVAEALGHRGDSAVDAYLALDAARMRACALPLSMLEGAGADA